MKVIHTRMDSAATEAGAFVAAGFFDGVHLGHAAVLGAALSGARAAGLEAWVFTFARHPRAFLSPGGTPPLLCPPEKRLDIFRGMGFDGVCLIDFDAEIAALPPEAFALRLKRTFPALARLCCGENWRFGNGGAGTAATLARDGAELGFAVEAVPVVLFDGATISSTRIRAAVAAGNLAGASAMLGRRHTISGKVLRGRRVGSANGIATANIGTGGLAIPPLGVYAVEARVADETFGGVADIGWRPTFPDARPDEPIVEAHLFGTERELYGETMEIAFLKFLRAERAFPTKDALFAQIAEDIAAAKAMTSRPAQPPTPEG